MKKTNSFYTIFNLSVLFFIVSLFFISLPFKSVYSFDIGLGDITEDQINLSEGILNLLKEEEDYENLQNIITSYNGVGPIMFSQDILDDIFSKLNEDSSSDKYDFFYDKILSFFKEKKLSFYNSSSYEQSFFKEKVEVFNDIDHITSHFIKVHIITDKNKESVYSNIKKKHSSESDGIIYTTRDYLLDNNLVGMIEGNDEKLKNEFIVIGINIARQRYHHDGNLYSFEFNQALTTAIFFNIIQNILNNRDKLKRSILFVAVSNDELSLAETLFLHRLNLKHVSNGTEAFIDYFNYYNDTRSKDQSKSSIYTFIDIEQLIYDPFLKDSKYLPSDLVPDSNSLYRSLFRTTIKDIDSLYHATNNQTLESIFKNIISKFKPILSDDNISDTSILASSSHFLTYDILNYYDIATLRFGTNITSVYSKYKKLPLPQDELQQYLDLSKIDNFMKTILVNIFYLSGRDPNLGLSKTKNPCISYFE